MTAGLLAAAIAAASGATLSQGGPGGYGPGMMGGGYGPGMMGGNHGPGMMGGGYGPGMMGGGHGPGMMGGGYGPGMMGGGYGPGMMGGGYGPGMMGGYAALELTDEQRQKLAALGEQARRRNWEAMGQLQAEQFKLRELLRADPVSASAVVEQQGKVDEVRRQVLKSRVETRNEMATVLTPEQRRKLHDAGPWWYREDAE
jgi:Spy/CpxP family protein refolding chaperone